jgi:hypothetical protein
MSAQLSKAREAELIRAVKRNVAAADREKAKAERYFKKASLLQSNAELDEEVETRDAEAEIEALAGMREVAYQKKRKEASADLRIPVVTLDGLVKKRRAKLEAEADAQLLYPHWVVEPWDEPVEGSTLLQTITERIRQHVILTQDQATAIALWIMLTWVHEQAAVHSRSCSRHQPRQTAASQHY